MNNTSDNETKSTLRTESILAQAGSRWDETTGAVSMPVHHATTFRHPGLGDSTGFDYSRTANPTRSALEDVLAKLEGPKEEFTQAWAFSSGMAAIDTIFHLFSPGDKVLVLEDLYGGTFRLMDEIYSKLGIEIRFATIEEFNDLETLFADSFSAVFVECPTNPVLKAIDLKALGHKCKETDTTYIVDNTFMTPILMKPFEYGADIVSYSCSKYIGGHNDVLSGALITNNEPIAERLSLIAKTTGGTLGPQDAWLLLRGIKTLALRLRQQESNAHHIANWLKKQPAVKSVYYPGLIDSPSYELMKSQAKGFGGMLSFELENEEAVATVLENLKLWIFAESLGGVESLITIPARQTHGDVPEEKRIAQGITEGLVRASVGIEDVEDLIADLEQAFSKIG